MTSFSGFVQLNGGETTGFSSGAPPGSQRMSFAIWTFGCAAVGSQPYIVTERLAVSAIRFAVVAVVPVVTRAQASKPATANDSSQGRHASWYIPARQLGPGFVRKGCT